MLAIMKWFRKLTTGSRNASTWRTTVQQALADKKYLSARNTYVFLLRPLSARVVCADGQE